jgi:hypothetical protein
LTFNLVLLAAYCCIGLLAATVAQIVAQRPILSAKYAVLPMKAGLPVWRNGRRTGLKILKVAWTRMEVAGKQGLSVTEIPA